MTPMTMAIGVLLPGIVGVIDHLAVGGDRSGLVCHGDQGGFGDRRAEAQAEREQGEPEHAALAREGAGHRFTDGKQALFQAMDEKGEAQHDEQDTQQDLREVRQGLLQHDKLEKCDNQDDGQQVAYAARHGQQQFFQDHLHPGPSGAWSPA
jgi:hypothetical protein